MIWPMSWLEDLLDLDDLDDDLVYRQGRRAISDCRARGHRPAGRRIGPAPN